MLHPHTELQFIKEEIGHGVVATRLIPRGTITWVRDELDQTLTPTQMEKLKDVYGDKLEKYCFIERGLWILCWDIARYTNHSCEANCMETGFDFEIAVRNIYPGEELTNDYGTLNLSSSFSSFACYCGSPHCRQIVCPDDSLRLADHWDQVVRMAFPYIASIPQPLWRWVKERKAVKRALAGLEPLPSLLLDYCPANQSVQTPSADAIIASSAGRVAGALG